MEGREGQDRAEERETQRKRDKEKERETEEKGKWNIKISGHVFAISGPISCLATSALHRNVGTHACPQAHMPTGIFTGRTQSLHPFPSNFLHKLKGFIVLLCTWLCPKPKITV